MGDFSVIEAANKQKYDWPQPTPALLFLKSRSKVPTQNHQQLTNSSHDPVPNQ